MRPAFAAMLSAAAISGLALAPMPARAQDSWVAPAPGPRVVQLPATPVDDGRYKFFRMQESVVRVDNQTGQVAECRHKSGAWTCQAAPEERAALEAEIGRLQAEIATLKRESLARGPDVPGTAKPNVSKPDVAQPEASKPEAIKPEASKPDPVPPVARAPERAPDKDRDPVLRLPSDADVERVTSFIEKFWKRLVEMMVNVQREIQRKDPTEKS